MDRAQPITCPHGTAQYKMFQWVHPNGSRCQTLGSTHYTRVAAAFHPDQRKRQDVVDAITKPDFGWLVTPHGLEALCRWLSNADASAPDPGEMFKRMAMLVVSPVYPIVERLLTQKIDEFKNNVRFVTRRVSGREYRIRRAPCGLVAAGKVRLYSMPNLQRIETDQRVQTAAQDCRRAFEQLDAQVARAAEEMRLQPR